MLDRAEPGSAQAGALVNAMLKQRNPGSLEPQCLGKSLNLNGAWDAVKPEEMFALFTALAVLEQRRL